MKGMRDWMSKGNGQTRDWKSWHLVCKLTY